MKKVIIVVMLLSLVLTSCTVSQKEEVKVPENKPETIQKDDKTEIKDNSKVEIGLSQGKMAPDFSLKDMDGKEVKLSDYRGKIVILNFFGVWCSWCRKEMPGFMKVYKDYKDKNVELVVVDNGDDRDTLVNYLKQNKFDIKPLMDTEDKVVRQYRVAGFPTTLILDQNGIIKVAHGGYMEESILRNLIDNVLK